MDGPTEPGDGSRPSADDWSALEWWLDESSLPRLTWARLRPMFDRGLVAVLDCDGKLWMFDGLEEARRWLREEEYESLADLKADGLVDPDLQPPAGFGAMPATVPGRS